MATDPYGFSDEALPAADGEPTRAMWYAIVAAMLGSVGVCFCYLPYFGALPLGAYAAYLGSKHMGSTDARDRSMATAATVSGVLSSVISAGFVMFILMYVLFIVAYIAIVFIAIGAGAMSSGSDY